MGKNNIIEQNTKAINDFFSFHKEDTAKELSKFLFRLQGAFFSEVNQDIDTSTEYKQECAMHFDMLFNLVNELLPVK